MSVRTRLKRLEGPGSWWSNLVRRYPEIGEVLGSDEPTIGEQKALIEALKQAEVGDDNQAAR